MTPPNKDLVAKLLQAAKAVGTVEKRGRNTQQSYDYVLAEDVAKAAHAALEAAGLVATFSVEESTELPITTRSGSPGLIVKVRGRLMVADPVTGATIEQEAMGMGADYPGDKGIFKAMTGARKYALIHLLGIPIGDDPDDQGGSEGPDPEGTITQAIAKAIVDRVWALGVKDRLALAVGHVAEKDIGDVSTKAKAIKALTEGITYAQAERLQNRLDAIEKDGTTP